jgi:hypothetical protein
MKKCCRRCKNVGESTTVGSILCEGETLNERLDRHDPNNYYCWGVLKRWVVDGNNPDCFGESFIPMEEDEK